MEIPDIAWVLGVVLNHPGPARDRDRWATTGVQTADRGLIVIVPMNGLVR